jgi:hypothetical protein
MDETYLKAKMKQIEERIPLATSVEEVMAIWREAKVFCLDSLAQLAREQGAEAQR